MMSVNWNKTFIMFITNQRLKLPNQLQVEDQIIHCVSKFKLLGVMIDDKLKFDAFINHQRIAINKRLYMLRRHYYLPFEVRLKFFKAFILPCVDYCASLFIYIKHDLLMKLCKTYCYCLKVLLKINLSNLDYNKSADQLKPYELLPFQGRLITRILNFLNKICSENASPCELKDYLKQSVLYNNNYELRSNNRVLVLKAAVKSKFGDLLINNIGATIINNLNILNFYINQKYFKNILYNNLNTIVNEFCLLLNSFDLIVNIDYYKS